MTDQNAPWTVTRLLDWTRDYFERAGVESARLCAEMLLSACLDCSRMELYARFDYQPKPEELGKFRGWVKQAAEGQPVAYLVGKKEFYSLTLKVTPDVLIPRPETELLVDQAVAHLRSLPEGADGMAWDVCTGSGCVALAVAKNAAGATVLATDVSPVAVAVATENAATCELAERVTVAAADLLTLPDEWTGPDEFDVITANPPYVAAGDPLGPTVEHEPPLALQAGDDGLDVIRPLIAGVAARLKPGGIFCMEFGIGQADTVRDLAVATGEFEEPAILKDHRNIERAAVAKKR